jgi:hypothetical protein
MCVVFLGEEEEKDPQSQRRKKARQEMREDCM